MKTRGFKIISDEHRKFPKESITLPKRGSKNSAGYDIYKTERKTHKSLACVM